MFRTLAAFVLGLALVAAAPAMKASAATTVPAGNILVLQLKDGLVKIRLDEKNAPRHAERLKTLASEGFYNGVVFHRVIDGFMAQTGDPTGTGSGGSSLPDLKAEFSSVPFQRGTVGMARAQSPDSANSQFFIMFAPGDFLNGKYTVVGQVVSGMQYVDAIKKGDEANNGMVNAPDKIIKAWVADK
ncbi:peptidylprolyl isomerase [Pseudoxanthobacter sp.]|uniref:peptidylprolyl isomerase n=1 Tax=Pseudoxanthobacter sp. TaxID=1925742 RepID=UPI002FDF381B